MKFGRHGAALILKKRLHSVTSTERRIYKPFAD
jgi:hypothetical protein